MTITKKQDNLSHADYTIGGGYIEEGNCMYCAPGAEFDGKQCKICGAYLIHKGNS